jgi:hypothetical protein
MRSQRTATVISVVATLLAACAHAPAGRRNDVFATCRRFFAEYGNLGRSGFATGMPKRLSEIVDGNARAQVQQDIVWYGDEGIRQKGERKVISLTEVAVNGDDIVVEVVLDSSGVTFENDGGEVHRSPETRQVLHLTVSCSDRCVVSDIDVVDYG